MPKRATLSSARGVAPSAPAALGPRPAIARPLPPPGAAARLFRLRHSASPPFEWEMHLQAAEGPDLILALPRGLPWAQGESRIAEAVGAADAARAPVWDEGRYHVETEDEHESILVLEGGGCAGATPSAATSAA